MDNQHYNIEELKEYLDPKFGRQNPARETDITDHLKVCEACYNLAKNTETEI